MTKKNLLILLMIIFIPLYCFSQKEGKLKFGDYAFYKGLVLNGKPDGEGTLTYKWKESTFAVKMIDKISGKFSGRIVEDATVTFAARKCSFQGKLRFDIGERGILTITMFDGVLILNGNEYSIINETYQADGEKSTCIFGQKYRNNTIEVNQSSEKSNIYVSVTDFKGSLMLPIQIYTPTYIETSISVDRYNGCTLDVRNESQGRQKIAISDKCFSLLDNRSLIYEAPDGNVNLTFEGNVNNLGGAQMDATLVYIMKKYTNGVIIKASCNKGIYKGKIYYPNGEYYDGSFIINDNDNVHDILDKDKLAEFYHVDGILTKLNGEKIAINDEERALSFIREKLAICDSIWNVRVKQSDKDVIKNVLVGKKYTHIKDVKIANVRLKAKTVISFIDETKVSIRMEAVTTSETKLPTNIAQMHMFLGLSENFGEDVKFDGSYVLVNGHIILRMDYRHCLEKFATKNSWVKAKDIVDKEWLDHCGENMISDYKLSKDYKTLTPFTPNGYSNQVFRIEY